MADLAQGMDAGIRAPGPRRSATCPNTSWAYIDKRPLNASCILLGLPAAVSGSLYSRVILYLRNGFIPILPSSIFRCLSFLKQPLFQFFQFRNQNLQGRSFIDIMDVDVAYNSLLVDHKQRPFLAVPSERRTL